MEWFHKITVSNLYYLRENTFERLNPSQILRGLSSMVATTAQINILCHFKLLMAFSSCFCFQEKDSKRQLRLRNGLMTQTAYSVTGLARVRGHTGETPLVRLRNPWGKGEWTGPWSERSWEWDTLSDRDKELLSVRVRNDGEFW